MFLGYHCEFDVDECISNPCLNGATCNNKVGSFMCSCLNGFEGKFCETNIDDCMVSKYFS